MPDLGAPVSNSTETGCADLKVRIEGGAS